MAKNSQTGEVRRGRIGDAEKLLILRELANETKKRYRKNLRNNPYGYDLQLLYYTLKYEPDVNAFENHYWLEGNTENLTRFAIYFEYGTGMHNIQRKSQGRRYIRSKTKGKKMVFEGTNEYAGLTVAAEKVKGVKPVMAMTKAVKSVDHERARLQREIRIRLKI